MPGQRPKLGKLATPVSATFPSEITSAATATPISAVAFPVKPDPDYIKTPISPPMAYTDFLSKAMSLNSPLPPTGDSTPESASMPGTASSEQSSCSCKVEESSPPTSVDGDKPSPPATAPIVPPSPFCPSAAPMSAPPTGPATFPSLRVPQSPSVANLDSPVRSPYSARSIHSAFDWDAALKARTQSLKKQPSRTSVRHLREVVTRTVTYTPRMDPAPKGKRRKVE
ncbi:uncharacterized protein F5Z01DRAFT_306640 [Emericellopsis atlantica]|uniref:Uncharacterized protein n=1 Tax=Emericellopsis atlantica TaxID=2614577 RepID=A0A9P7ZU36_9HYPO|nr:uncharacterized protein F5Z01DRAFT_306640 [Emericellopsis atlantica]KAG9257856.1 hypothetical protein F5Z01DRAFT_306640 [Emericellopsis atlantica]